MSSFWRWQRSARPDLPGAPPPAAPPASPDDDLAALIPWIVAFYGNRGQRVDPEWVRRHLEERAAARRRVATEKPVPSAGEPEKPERLTA